MRQSLTVEPLLITITSPVKLWNCRLHSSATLGDRFPAGQLRIIFAYFFRFWGFWNWVFDSHQALHAPFALVGNVWVKFVWRVDLVLALDSPKCIHSYLIDSWSRLFAMGEHDFEKPDSRKSTLMMSSSQTALSPTRLQIATRGQPWDRSVWVMEPVSSWYAHLKNLKW